MRGDRDSTIVVSEAFDDVALLIGSVAAARNLPDDLVEVLISRLDRVRVRTLGRLRGRREEAEVPRLQPAVEKFLLRNGQGVSK